MSMHHAATSADSITHHECAVVVIASMCMDMCCCMMP